MFFALTPSVVKAQCAGIPSVTSLGSNKVPEGLCAPVQATVTYSVSFTAAVQPGTLELIYEWGDGTPTEVIPLKTGLKTYSDSRLHNFPKESDCEYYVTMMLRYNGQACTNTTQVQRIASWRTDHANGGDVSLVSPITKTKTHFVCEGEDIDVILKDVTNWNCNANYIKNGADTTESPNLEYRWQQIVYNTSPSSGRIPGVRVDGVLVTDKNGASVISNYQDPRGVFFMSAPVVLEDERRRPSMKITADGGFASGLPKAGDEFEITLRYWNFCNPYDDPEIPGPPADLINGDHPPVEDKAVIKITAPPAELKATYQSVCFGTTPSVFYVTGIGKGNIVKWYEYVPGSEVPGALIASGKKFLPVTAHPNWQNNTTPGVYSVWATQRTDLTEQNCESQPILVTRTIREALFVPDPVADVPSEVCNGESFTVSFSEPATEITGGATSYKFLGTNEIVPVSSTSKSVTFKVNVDDFQDSLYADKSFTVIRHYTTAPSCEASRVFNIRIFREPAGGIISGLSQVCENDSIGNIALTGYIGNIRRWEWKKDNDVFSEYANESNDTIFLGVFSPGSYTFRAVVENGICGQLYSEEHKLEISDSPLTAAAGDDQFICSALSSAALNASDPSPGKGQWTYVSSVPAGLPPPSFDIHNPNTTVVITSDNAGSYIMRWTVTNGVCVSSDDVLIDFGTNPTDPDAGDDKVVCGVSTNLEGNIPEKGLGSWSVVNGPDCAGEACPISIASPTSPISAVNLRDSSLHYGRYTLRWSISSGGNNCFLKSDDVVIDFQQLVTAEANDITNICIDSTKLSPILLTGFAKGPIKNVEWINITGKGTISAQSVTSESGGQQVNAYYNPSIDDYKNGASIQVKLRVNTLNEFCNAAEKIVFIDFDRKPTAIAGPDAQTCDQQMILKAKVPLYEASGRWTTENAAIKFSDVTDPDATVSNLPLGSTSLTWTVTSSRNICPSDTSSLTITRVSLPEVKDITIVGCEEQPGRTNVFLSSYEDSVTSITRENREITWYNNEDFSTSVDGSVLQQNVQHGTVYVAYVRDLRTGCQSLASATVKVRELPIVRNAVVSQCEDVAGSNTVSGIDLTDENKAITEESSAVVSWYFSEADAISKHSPIEDLVMVDGQQSFFARVTFGDSPYCYSIARLDFVADPRPLVTSIFGKEFVCEGDDSDGNMPVEVYQVLPHPGAKYYWDIPGNDGQFKLVSGAGEEDFYALLQFPTATTEKITVRAELNGCSGPTAEKVIHVSASPLPPVIEGTSFVCEDEKFVSFNVEPNHFPAATYYWEVKKSADNTFLNSYIVDGQSTGSILVNFKKEDVTISVQESNTSCVSSIVTKAITVLDVPEPEFTIEKDQRCEGNQFHFKWRAQDSVSYRWEWGDGTVKQIAAGEIAEGENQVTHVYQSSTNGKSIEYTVKLFVSYPGCQEKAKEEAITVVPALQLDITASDTLLCSGEAVTFLNNSLGGTDGTWYARPIQSTTTIKPESSSSKNATFVLKNESEEPALMYEIVYEAQNESGCKEVYRQHVYVYQPTAASFIVDSITTFNNGQAEVFIKNSSALVNDRHFLFNWNFNGGSPDHATDDRSLNVKYYAPGKKNITLTVVNKEAKEYEKVCESTFVQQIIIPVDELKASFTATPQAACSPVTVEVQNNSTGADAYLWKLFRAGSLVTTSNLARPQFTIADPGVYELELTAHETGSQKSDKAVFSNIQVFEVPYASFEVRTNVVYAPDIPVEIFNFSFEANQYEWHFGDGQISDEREPTHLYENEGKYAVMLIAKADHGEMVCYDTAVIAITALVGGDLQIPNAFTPNTDGPNSGRINDSGVNDVFLPIGKGVAEFHMQLYDRWGALIFESHDKEVGWNGYNAHGLLMPAGVYVYKIRVRLSDGEQTTRLGDVTLIH